jgi:cobalt/nickel transport system permease protein
MNPFPIDAYAYANRLRGTHPAEKMIFAGVTIAICLVSGSILVAALALITMALVLSRAAGIPVGVFWRFVRLPAGFIVAGVLTMAVIGVPADGNGSLASMPIGPWRIGVTAASLSQAAHVLAVSLACVGCTLFLALTTPMIDITDQMRRWHVPVLFTELMTLTYRFIFVLLETAQLMHLAQESRLGYCTWGQSLRSVGMLASNLFLRAHARARALFTALTARGYTGDLNVLRDEPRWSARDVAFIVAADGLLLAAAAAVHVGGLV